MMVLNSDRFLAEERHHSQYKLDSTLTLRDLRKEDFGTYRYVFKYAESIVRMRAQKLEQGVRVISKIYLINLVIT